MTITFFNFGEKTQKILGGDTWTIAKEANDAKITAMVAKDSLTGVEQLYQGFSANGSQYIDALKSGTAANLASSSTSATAYRFFPSQTVQNMLPSALKSLDKSLLETGFGQGIVEKLGGSTTFASAGGNTTASITGSTAAQVGGKAMAKIPIIGIIVSSLFEIPDIMDAFKNGDGGQQVGRSALKVAGTTLGTAIGGALGTLIPIPGLGTLIGAVVGGWLGGLAGEFLGNAIFGKSIKDQTMDGTKTKEIINSYKNLNFNNVGKSTNVGGATYTGNYNYDGGGSNNVDVQKTLDYVNEGMAQYGLS